MAYIYKTYSSGGTNNQKKFTASVWVKRCATGVQHEIASAYKASNGFQTDLLKFNSDDTLRFYSHSDSGQGATSFITNAKFRDVNAWYHIVLNVDTTNSTSNERFKMWVNGEQITSWSTATYPPLDNSMIWGMPTDAVHQIGALNGSHTFNGLMSHFHYVQNAIHAPTVFGSTDSTTGEWSINPSPSGITYSDQSFWFFKNDNLATDRSGNGNNWSTNGTLTKTEDNPSNVFATCSKEPIRTVSGTQLIPVLSNGNTTWDATGVSGGASVTLSTLGATTGKYYMEAKVGGSYAGHSRIGVGTFEGYDGTTFFNSTSSNYAAYTSNGEKNIAGTTSSYGASYAAGDIISVALDCDNNTVTFYKNGASQGAISITNNDNFKHFSCGGYDATGSNITNWICNFGNGYFGTTAVSSAGTNASNNGIFEYDVPTGYTALSTKGLNL